MKRVFRSIQVAQCGKPRLQLCGHCFVAAALLHSAAIRKPWYHDPRRKEQVYSQA